ncbi:hypothetical protein RR46_00223 [Papilio xuthus]|uniref:Uncharacterized protein n=1 Tax=Papilio xuthus TaxID=66420 RepID=A0A0N1IBV6_PAPXU|nr:hypothetical protein RR46_00223 [Papilio xuthus]
MFHLATGTKQRRTAAGAHIHGFPLPERRSVMFRKCVPITGIIEP